MIVAMPIKKLNGEFVVSNKFGKAKLFAIVDLKSNEIQIKSVNFENGKQIVEFLERENVEAIIVSHIGLGALKHAKGKNIKVFLADKHTKISDVLNLYKEGKLEEIKTDLNHINIKCVS